MNPLLIAAAASAVFAAVAIGLALWLGAKPADARLERRLRQTAEAIDENAAGYRGGIGGIGVLQRRPTQAMLFEWIDRRFPMLEGRKVFPKAAAVGVLAAVAAVIAGVLMQFGALNLLLLPAGWAGGTWAFLSMRNSRMQNQFLQRFPEIVDNVMRLTRVGLPAVEAVAVVAEEAQEPAKRILQQVSKEFASGLEPELVLRGAAARLRIPEFTLFSAALCVQRTTGGALADMLGNLSATLRGRLEVEGKAQASTAQTRITLWVLAAVPVVVLSTQQCTNPQATELLFNTDAGATLLRWGVGLVVAGLLVARGIAARFVR